MLTGVLNFELAAYARQFIRMRARRGEVWSLMPAMLPGRIEMWVRPCPPHRLCAHDFNDHGRWYCQHLFPAEIDNREAHIRVDPRELSMNVHYDMRPGL